jgi:hypothetical protein
MLIPGVIPGLPWHFASPGRGCLARAIFGQTFVGLRALALTMCGAIMTQERREVGCVRRREENRMLRPLRHPWTLEEEARLQAMADSGVYLRNIALRLRRSEDSVKNSGRDAEGRPPIAMAAHARARPLSVGVRLFEGGNLHGGQLPRARSPSQRGASDITPPHRGRRKRASQR